MKLPRIPCENCIVFASCNAKLKSKYKVYKTNHLIRDSLEPCELFYAWYNCSGRNSVSSVYRLLLEITCETFNIEIDIEPDTNLLRHLNPCRECLVKVQCKDRLIDHAKYRMTMTQIFPRHISPIRYILYKSFNETLRSTCWRAEGYMNERIEVVQRYRDYEVEHIVVDELMNCFDLILNNEGMYE